MCGEKKSIRQSHIIPKFVGEWIKRESGTGRLLGTDRDIDRRQDLHKMRLLCDCCEERFSKYETYFASKIFYPFYSDLRSFEYDSNLELFATSLCWRALQNLYCKIKPKTQHRHLFPLIDDAERCWRDFLLGESQTNPYETHMIFLGSEDVDPLYGHNWYKSSTVDMTLGMSASGVFVYVKMLRIIVVSQIFPLVMDGWGGTLIKTRGKLATTQMISDSEFQWFFNKRARMALTIFPDPTSGRIRTWLKRELRSQSRFLKSGQVKLLPEETDEHLVKRLEQTPTPVRELIVRALFLHAGGPGACDEDERRARWDSRRMLARLAGVPNHELLRLDQAIREAMRDSAASQKHAQRAWQTISLQVVFMVHPDATREQQHSRLLDEVGRIKQTDSAKSIGVFSVNYGRSGCRFESWLSVRP